ncbi:unnamed protein product [Tenebrio molitor]|nr:unnamed protein product [Tenebrio molitor]
MSGHYRIKKVSINDKNSNIVEHNIFLYKLNQRREERKIKV